MRLEMQVKCRKQAIGQLKTILHPESLQRWPQEKIQKFYHEMRQNLRLRGMPRYELCYLDGYFEALLDRWVADKVVFLYKVDGKFYTTGKDAMPGYPTWEALPRERWDSLADHGGFFYKDTLTIYFLSGTPQATA